MLRTLSAVIAVLSLVSQVGCAGSQRVDRDAVATALAHVRDSERSLVNVHVRGSAKMDKPAQISGGLESWKWKPTPCGNDVEAWLNGAIDGPFRLRVSDEISDWLNGPEGAQPYAESSYDVAFDGTRVVQLNLSEGSRGRVVPSTQATVDDKANNYRDGGPSSYGAGGSFTANFYLLGSQQTLSAFIGSYLNAIEQKLPGAYGYVTRVLFHGQERVCLIVGSERTCEYRFYLDPDRNWVLEGYEYRAGSSQELLGSFYVSKFVEAAPGCWYPATAEAMLALKTKVNGVEQMGGVRWRYSGTEIIANNVSIEKAIRELVIPTGTPVNDLIQKKEYISASSTTN